MLIHAIEFDANTGRLRMSVSNQQADRLGDIVFDKELGHVYVNDSGGSSPELEALLPEAKETLARLDAEVLPRPSAAIELPGGNRNNQLKAVLEVFTSDPLTAYDRLVSSWREQGQWVIRMALETLCRNEWRARYGHDAPYGGWENLDPRWAILGKKLSSPGVIGLESETAARAFEVANRKSLLERARRLLKARDCVAHYSAIQLGAERPESVAARRAFTEALKGAGSDALMRLEEALPGPLEPRPRMLAEEIITSLGEQRVVAAIPVLVAVAQNGQRELRIRALGALGKYDDPQAVEFLAACLVEADPLLLPLVLRATFSRDPKQAFDQLQPHIAQRGDDFLLAVLSALYRNHRDAARSDASRDWFRADPRWQDLCLPLARMPKNNASTEDPVETQIANLSHELVNREQ